MTTSQLTYAIILNYNSSEESIALFRNLEELNEKSLVILVIDNASPEEDRQLLKNAIPKSNLILNNSNKGYAAGNNVGINIALQQEAEYIWILNPDIRVEKESLQLLLSTMNADKEIAAIGPRILRREDKEVIFSDGEKLYFDEKCSTEHKNSWLKDIDVSGSKDYDIDYVDGSCILLRASAIKEIGMLPEKYFLYFEETHWCVEAKRKGWKLAVNSNAKVFNLTSEKNGIFHYYFMRNRLLFCKRYHPNFKTVRRYYFNLLLNEFLNRFKGKYFKPFYRSRLKGFFAGVYRTI
ncbi:glycosyltransferase family 2 protein [Gramella sp. KN1008]|uniref:glycosyltransferase family 2 protein n=1 Tax=Gramella sp. KN1008 TaxID=2529298 RepID=UPI001039A670|nr:glycosyltransferase family 2 protein [Gramella sp. KN1008]TBW25572.1 glycosyltransferase family 2 protein [Gramella sp. KN1008]